jgi:hypothetical protein
MDAHVRFFKSHCGIGTNRAADRHLISCMLPPRQAAEVMQTLTRLLLRIRWRQFQRDVLRTRRAA